MPIPDIVGSGDSGHIQDHNDISSVLTEYETRIDQLESDFDLLPASADIATELYVDSAIVASINDIINSAPTALNTLDELAAALGDDANFAATVTNSLSQKQPIDADLTAIAGLSANSGLLRKTEANTWTLDTTNFAATSYVDSAISTSLNSYLPLAGGTLTGQVSGTTANFSGNVSGSSPTQNGHLATKAYVDSVAAGTLSNSITINSGTGLSGGGQTTLGGSITLSNSGILSITGTQNQISVSTVNGVSNLSLTNNVSITGNITSLNPTESNHLTTKSYVDGLSTSANSYTDSSIFSHTSDTTNVHGIADTSLLATKSYADTAASTAVSNIIDSAPSALNTLNELAEALNDDPNFATTISTQIGNKANQSDLTNHTNATTNVHGIADTANIVLTNDSRLSNSRTPTSHASSHSSAGSDPITISQSQVVNLVSSLSDKAPIASPIFTGTPAAPTATSGTNTTQVATTAYVRGEISSLVASAPAALDTLNELSIALGNDPNFATTISTQIGNKANQSDLTNHTNATTNVHGIADTALLATKSYVDIAESDAITTANSYTNTKVFEITGKIEHTARATWTGSAIQSSVQAASVGIITVTFPVGKFSQIPKVFTQNIDDGSSSRMAYAKFTPYSISTSSVSMQIINNAPPSTVSGGGTITKAIVDILAVQEA
jgi:hypothetical protein